MRINNDCARDVLLEVENIPFGESISVEKLKEKLEKYTIEDVISIVTLFNREHYLTVLDKVSYDDNDVFRDNKIKCLTERGYKTLDIIRDEELWNDIKGKMANFDDVSIYTIIDVANRITTSKYNSLFNLPADFTTINPRW